MYVYNTEVFRFFLFFIGFFSRLNRLESDTEPTFCIETLVPDSCVFVANELAPDSLVSRKYPTKLPNGPSPTTLNLPHYPNQL